MDQWRCKPDASGREFRRLDVKRRVSLPNNAVAVVTAAAILILSPPVPATNLHQESSYIYPTIETLEPP